MSRILIQADPDLAELIPGFLEKRVAEIATLREALARADLDAVRAIAHKIKGNAGGYGFDAMGDIGARLETVAKAGDAEAAASAVDELADHLQRIDVVYP